MAKTALTDAAKWIKRKEVKGPIYIKDPTQKVRTTFYITKRAHGLLWHHRNKTNKMLSDTIEQLIIEHLRYYEHELQEKQS